MNEAVPGARPLANAGAVVLALTLLCMATLDRPLALYMKAAVDGDTLAIWQTITRLGDATGYVIAALLLLVIAGAGRRVLTPGRRRAALDRLFRYNLLLLLGLALSGAAVNGLKIALGRLRPRYLFESGASGFQPLNFDVSANTLPSGHAQVSFALAAVLWLAWPRWAPVIVAGAATVALSRVVVTTHYLSDVLLGAYLGVAAVLLLAPRLLDSPRP